MDKNSLTYFIVTILGVFSVVNEKARNFLLGKVTYKKETTDATDATIEKLMGRVNKLSEEFIKLNENNIQTQKENFELQHEHLKLKKDIVKKCKNNCFE